MISDIDAKFLIEHSIITPLRTIVELENGTEFVILKIIGDSNQAVFLVKNPKTSQEYQINFSVIKKIDGMPIDKVIKAYDDLADSEAIEFNIETDACNNVNGKESATVDGIELEEDMRIIFHNDITPKMNERPFKVKIRDGVIKLVAPRGRPKKVK